MPSRRAVLSGRRAPLSSVALALGAALSVCCTVTAVSASAASAPATVSGLFVAHVAGSTDSSHGAVTPGPASASLLGGPQSVAFDGAGDLYVADSYDNQIDKVTPAGILSVFAGTGQWGAPVAGPAAASPLSFPEGIAVDPAGDMYVADSHNDDVERITPGGTLSVVAGTGTAGSPTPGPATVSALDQPISVAVHGGDLYIADYVNHVVEKITDGVLSIVAGNGAEGAPTPGPAADSALGDPGGLAFDAAGNLYIADVREFVVDRVDTEGMLSVAVGIPGREGTPTAGPATGTSIGWPQGLTVAADGTLYIADNYENYVYAVTPDGTLSIAAGTGARAASVPGPATGSPFGSPSGVALDESGHLFVANYDSASVEELYTPVAPSAPGISATTLGNTNVAVTLLPSAQGDLRPSYTVTAAPGGKTCTIASTASPLACYVTGLTNGAAYTFTATAANGSGTSAASAASAPVVPNQVPATPVLGAVTAGYQSLTVTVSPHDSGGLPSRISVSAATVSGPAQHANCADIAVTVRKAYTCTMTGLTNGTTYRLSMQASNSAGASDVFTDPAGYKPGVTVPTKVSDMSSVNLTGLLAPGQTLVTLSPAACSVSGQRVAFYYDGGLCALAVRSGSGTVRQYVVTISAKTASSPADPDLFSGVTYFAAGSVALSPVAVSALTKALPQLRKAVTVAVFGSVSPGTGTDAYKVKVGQQRADAVASWLRSHAVKVTLSASNGAARQVPGGAAVNRRADWIWQ